jgi:hypothetical protein
MAQLVVRQLEETIVQELRKRVMNVRGQAAILDSWQRSFSGSEKREKKAGRACVRIAGKHRRFPENSKIGGTVNKYFLNRNRLSLSSCKGARRIAIHHRASSTSRR